MNASLPCGIKGRYPKNAIAKANNFSIINVKIVSQIYLSCHYNNLLTVFKNNHFCCDDELCKRWRKRMENETKEISMPYNAKSPHKICIMKQLVQFGV